MRALLSAFLVATFATIVPAVALASEATTTRIETRPFYGATVTLEAGVRVFRPLPPHSKVIINPGGKTPVSLGFEENRFVSHNHNYNYGGGSPDLRYVDGDNALGFVGDGHGRRHRPHRRSGSFKGHQGHGGKH